MAPLPIRGPCLSSAVGYGILTTAAESPQKELRKERAMPRQSVFDMAFSKVYPLLIQKAEKKGRTRAEVYEVTCWLTGYTAEQLEEALLSPLTYGAFLADAPAWNPRAEGIKGKICGVQVETIDDPLMKKARQLDKLVDALAKGKPMEKIFPV